MSTQINVTVAEAVEAAKQGRRTVLLCPAHDDQNPSLSISPGTEQEVLLHCHAACTTQQIIDAAGLEWEDVCSPLEERPEEVDLWTPVGRATHRYPYFLADGTLSYEVLRVPTENGGKRFMQRRPDPEAKGGYTWRLDNVERLPYRLPQVLEAIKAGATIHVAEGEKCVHALLRVIPKGDEATCNSGGAGKFLGTSAHYFAGANVVIYADSDDPGRQHARDVREMLTEQGCRVRTVEAPPGVMRNGKAIGDVADHLEAGGTLDQMLETTPESDMEKARTGIDILDLIGRDRKPTDWAIEGTLAKGERLVLIGFEGSGKSTLCRQMAVCVAAGLHPFTKNAIEPKRVLFIDAENHPTQVIDSWSHLVGLAARHSHPIEAGMLTVLEEFEGERDLTSHNGAAWLRERVFAYRPDLVVMGPLTNLADRDLKDYEVVNRMRKTVNGIREICNSAIVMEHHAPLRGGGDKVRELRPYGSGLFLKWPDYAYGLQPTETDGTYEWRRNRGDRVRGRHWPDGLREGNSHFNSIEWPWEECIVP